jgi:hypothetical protein
MLLRFTSRVLGCGHILRLSARFHLHRRNEFRKFPRKGSRVGLLQEQAAYKALRTRVLQHRRAIFLARSKM